MEVRAARRSAGGRPSITRSSPGADRARPDAGAGRVRLPQRDGLRLGNGRFKCSACGWRTPVTAGTIFDRTRTPFILCFTAC